MDMTNYPKVDHRGLARLVTNSARTRRPLCVLGAPGTGKTAVAGNIARRIGRKLVWFDLGNGAREDAMLPVSATGPDGRPVVVRIPLDALAAACAEPVVLFIDEVTRCDKNKQAVAMALSNERRIGSYVLHPETVVIVAGNGLESSGTYALADAFINRLCVVELVPDREDARDIIANLDALAHADEEPMGAFVASVLNDAAFREQFRTLAQKYSAIAGSRTELLALTPPAGAQETGAQWPSLRAVHHMLERMAALLTAGEELNEVALAEAGGVIGREAAAAWFAVLAHESKLPSVDEVLQSPKTAKLPPDIESAVAALGLVKVVHNANHNAAWLYVERFGQTWPEVQSVIARDLLAKVPTEPEALAAYNRVVGRINLTTARSR